MCAFHSFIKMIWYTGQIRQVQVQNQTKKLYDPLFLFVFYCVLHDVY